MLYDDSRSDSGSDSDSDDDLDLLLLETMFPLLTKLGVPRLNLEDLSEMQCEQMFRYESLSVKYKSIFLLCYLWYFNKKEVFSFLQISKARHGTPSRGIGNSRPLYLHSGDKRNGDGGPDGHATTSGIPKSMV